MPRSLAMRWMESAIMRACCSLSITQGPAMRKSWPRPTGTLPISKSCLLTEERILGGASASQTALTRAHGEVCSVEQKLGVRADLEECSHGWREKRRNVGL